MPEYPFYCEKCGEIIVKCSIKEIQEKMPCVKCGTIAKREYKPIADIWKTDGAFSKTNHT